MTNSKIYELSMKEFVHIVENSIYNFVSDVSITAYLSKEPLKFSEKEKGEKVKLNIGDVWGQRYDCGWFHIEADIPNHIDTNSLYLIIDMSGEGCVFTKDGVPYRALTTRCALYEQWIGKHHKKTCDIAPFIENGKLSMWIDCGANDVLGSLYNSGVLSEAYLGTKNENFYKLSYDIDVLYSLGKALEENSPRKAQIEKALYDASKIMSTGALIRSGVNYLGSPDNTKENYKGTDEQAIKALKILKPLLNQKGGDCPITHHMVGHSHIDLAWLWPIRETKRKCARTFSNVLRNMEKYPNYKFVQSQAQAYQWIKEDHPILFDQIKDKVKDGSWEVNGGMWVEADGNIASGESFVRQFLYGKKFFKEEFGVDCQVCHLPDTFGYNGALPQIIKEADMNYFLFQKMMVNFFNPFPYNSFKWQGIDGTEILCHMPPCNTYQSNCLPETSIFAERNYSEKDISKNALSMFGIGDGGSGPGEEHLERIIRQKNLNGVGKNIMSSSIDFFKVLEKESKDLPTQYGEMYLEFHQGTLTSQSKNKWYNRYLENALRNLEIISVLGKIHYNIEYNKSEIESIWKEVLLYQFHDILPGSSIQRVYDESIMNYKKLYNKVNSLTDNILEKIGGEKEYSLINTLSFNRDEFIKINNKWEKVSVPGLSIKSIDLTNKKYKSVKVKNNSLENDFIKVTFTKEGFINIYDKESQREVFSNSSNRLTIFEDTIDAWDMYPDYIERGFEYPNLSKIEFIKEEPVGIVKLQWTYNDSVIKQKIILKPNTKELDVENFVDWHEACKMLRVVFEPDIITDYSRSEIQFGNIKRSYKNFTNYDKAKYEICAHKWIDLSEKDFGFALINDSKYGHFAKEGFLSLNLLRSTSYPDPNGDQGEHKFNYRIKVHNGDYGEVVESAYGFNNPIIIKKNINKNKDIESLIKVPNNLIVEAIKEAEYSNNIIIRLYEGKEKRGKSKITFSIPVKKVYLTNILENKKKELKISDNSIIIDTKPFKIWTLLVEI